MPRPFHSSALFIEALSSLEGRLVFAAPTVLPSVPCPEKTRFGYMFDQVAGDRLTEDPKTVKDLMDLGISMRDPDPLNSKFDSKIPSIYTYFSQFVAHDLTFDPITKDEPLNEKITPLPPNTVNSLLNRRTGLLDLDNVYGPGLDEHGCFEVPRKGEEMELAFAYGSTVYGTDVPRGENPPHQARIGDSRNDENITTSQIHLAFLRAHNLIVKDGHTYDEAKTLLRRRYQRLVIKDLLPKLVHRDDIKRIVDKEIQIYSPPANDLFMPIEFTAAAFRYGHSMIRSRYDFNQDRGNVPLRQLFTPNALGDYRQLLADWVIDWRNFIAGGTNAARSFCPQLVEPLEKLIDSQKNPGLSLAVRDLLRGYLLGLPTGQAVARSMKITPLTPSEIEDSAIDDVQRKVLRDTGFSHNTPLWFYLFAEARIKRDGSYLGPVCGQMVAAVLIELARRNSLPDDDPWDPILGEKEDFDLSNFILKTLPVVN